MNQPVLNWGNYPVPRQEIWAFPWRHALLPVPGTGQSLLPHGLGRSYGDSCLNAGNILLDTTRLDRFIAWEKETGVLECEAGVSFDEILRLIVPHGWFLPVVPGTKFITLAGAIANDIHGKNHHRDGTFGCYVQKLELLRSDGQRLMCSRDEHPELFAATIGGLGLTGLITRACVELRRIPSSFIATESIRFDSLQQFLEISELSNARFEYAVAWIDCLACGPSNIRGIFLQGNHHTGGTGGQFVVHAGKSLSLNVPANLPEFFLNRSTAGLFNRVQLWRHGSGFKSKVVPYDSFFFPLDAIGRWNRIYGRRGLIQYQCVIPYATAGSAMTELLQTVVASPAGSFLGVLKVFGDKKSPGLMSFPAAGVTVALDFPNRGPALLELLDQLDRIVLNARGRIYLAKDCRTQSQSFASFYPQWREFSKWIDPKFSSDLWRRVTSGLN